MAELMLVIEGDFDPAELRKALYGSGNDDSPALAIEKIIRYETGDGFDAEFNDVIIDGERKML